MNLQIPHGQSGGILQPGGILQDKTDRNVAVAIAIDCTGSMAPYVKAAVRATTNLVTSFSASSHVVSFGMVLYRDELVGEMPELFPVGTSPDRIKAILSRVKAHGGGDIPESALPAIHQALALPGYREDAQKVIFFVSDAPCHDPEGPHTSLTVKKELEEHNAIFFACAPESVKTYEMFCRLNGGGILFPISPDMAADAFSSVVSRLADHTRRTMRMNLDARVTRFFTEKMRETRRIS